jgi:hypothetical protein
VNVQRICSRTLSFQRFRLRNLSTVYCTMSRNASPIRSGRSGSPVSRSGSPFSRLMIKIRSKNGSGGEFVRDPNSMSFDEDLVENLETDTETGELENRVHEWLKKCQHPVTVPSSPKPSTTPRSSASKCQPDKIKLDQPSPKEIGGAKLILVGQTVQEGEDMTLFHPDFIDWRSTCRSKEGVETKPPTSPLLGAVSNAQESISRLWRNVASLS